MAQEKPRGSVCGIYPAKTAFIGTLVTSCPMLKAQLSLYIRSHIGVQLYDDSDMSPVGTAIYSLSDPRDIREVRYVGQTSNPRRRFLQHLNAACLWLPDERPWWVKSPELRPLYDWMKELYRDEFRLPTMVISAWVALASDARRAERARIYECLSARLPLLNVETERLGPQFALL